MSATSGQESTHMPSKAPPSPLRLVDAQIVSQLASREARNREIFIPPLSAYRWWARRTSSVNTALLEAFETDHGRQLLVADPFAGGGVIPVTALARGHRVYAQDLNPWAVFGLAGMLSLAGASSIGDVAKDLRQLASRDLDEAYGTVGPDGQPAEVAHTLRVACAPCPSCGSELTLFPHALVSLRARRERGRPEAFLACPRGHLFEGTEDGGRQVCPTCGENTEPKSAYTTKRFATCLDCGTQTKLSMLATGGHWLWRVALIQRAWKGGRELSLPLPTEIAQAEHADGSAPQLGRIPDGQETRVLLRHGFERWEDIYPKRQARMLGRLLTHLRELDCDKATTAAIGLAIVGAAEMAGYLSRWDRFYMKSYEAMAGHRFNFTTLACEPNVWGAGDSGRGTVSRRLVAFSKASRWFAENDIDRLNLVGPIRPDDASPQPMTPDTQVQVVEGSSENMLLASASVDLVLTDPPYHNDVQYGELSLPLRAWAGLGVDALQSEALVSSAMGTNSEALEYRTLLTNIFTELQRVLRPTGHLIFSYANRDVEAWVDVLAALQQAGFHGCGATILHSENESDLTKRGVGACTLDLILDVTPVPPQGEMYSARWDSPEGHFLERISQSVLEIGALSPHDLHELAADLAGMEFIASRPRSH